MNLRTRSRKVETIVSAQERYLLGPLPRSIGSSATTSSSRDVLPANHSASLPVITPSWVPATHRRLQELQGRPAGWDSYDAAPLERTAVAATARLLCEYGGAIQSGPSVSLTVEGGLVLEWESDEATLEYKVSPTGDGEVSYAEGTGQEWDGPAAECVFLDKWLWRASHRHFAFE